MPLTNSEKYRTHEVQKSLTWAEWLVQRANTEIRIEDVLKLLYNISVPYDAHSWKVTCPYGREHEDGGLDKQFRIYSDTNTAYCFAMHGSYNNVRLWRTRNPYAGLEEAAKALLDYYGIDYHKKSYRDRFEELREKKEFEADSEVVIEAFTIFLSSIPNYDTLQYRQEVLDAVELFLSTVHQKCEQFKNGLEVSQWLQTEKQKMQTLLDSLQ